METTKILAISSSPHRGGNTETMLDAAIEGVRAAGAEVEKLSLNDYSMAPCRGCCGCCKTGICVIKDDYHLFNEKMRQAHHIMMATPIQFGSVCAQLKILIDRTQTFWAEKYLLKRKIGPKGVERKGLIMTCSALHNKEFFENVRQILHICFLCQDINKYEMISEMGIKHKGDIKDHQEALERCRKAGENLVLVDS